MYLLTKDYTSDDGDSWLVGSYDDEGNWVNAPTVAGHTIPSYDFHTASQHLVNMNAEIDRIHDHRNAYKQKENQDSLSAFLKTAIFAALFVFLFVISIRILAAIFIVMIPLMLVFFGIIIAMIVIKGIL